MSKELKVKLQPSGRMYSIYFEGGGELPKELEGAYTSPRTATASIASYLKKRELNVPDKKTARTK
jgi:hypothetical protein